MATPHVAGSGALLRQLHPTWAPSQIKSGQHCKASGVQSLGYSIVDTVSVSFGVFTGNLPINTSQVVAVQNVSSGDLTCDVSSSQDSGGTTIISTSSSTFNVNSGGSGSLTLLLNAAKSVPSGDYFGDIAVLCPSSPTFHVPWWARISRRPS